MSNRQIKFNDKAPFQVCIVKYTCGTCFRRWQSANGNLNDYQLCKHCYQKCYPGEYKWQAPNKKGNHRETFVAHNTELCGKCIRLGFSCMELPDEGKPPGIVVSNDEGEDFLLENNLDLSNFIVIKEKVDKKKMKADKKSGKNTMTKAKQERQEWSALMDEEKKGKAKTKINKAKEDIKFETAILTPRHERTTTDKDAKTQKMLETKKEVLVTPQGTAKDGQQPDYISFVLMIINAAKRDGKALKEDVKGSSVYL